MSDPAQVVGEAREAHRLDFVAGRCSCGTPMTLDGQPAHINESIVAALVAEGAVMPDDVCCGEPRAHYHRDTLDGEDTVLIEDPRLAEVRALLSKIDEALS